MISYWIRIWSVLVISLDQNMCTGCPKIRTNYWIYSPSLRLSGPGAATGFQPGGGAKFFRNKTFFRN